MIVTGVLESWYDPNRPVFIHEDGTDLGSHRKVGADSYIHVECRSERIANDMVAVLQSLGYIGVMVEA